MGKCKIMSGGGVTMLNGIKTKYPAADGDVKPFTFVDFADRQTLNGYINVPDIGSQYNTKNITCDWLDEECTKLFVVQLKESSNLYATLWSMNKETDTLVEGTATLLWRAQLYAYRPACFRISDGRMLVTDTGRYPKIAIVTVSDTGAMSVGSIIQPFASIDDYSYVRHVYLYPFQSNPNRFLLHIHAEYNTAAIDWAVVLTVNDDMITAAKPIERLADGRGASGWLVSDTIWARQGAYGTRPMVYLHTIGDSGEIQEYTNSGAILSISERMLAFGPSALVPLGNSKYVFLFGGATGTGQGIDGIYYTIVTYNGENFDVVRDTTLLDQGTEQINWGGEWTKVGKGLIVFISASTYYYNAVPRQCLISVDACNNSASVQGSDLSYLEAGYSVGGLTNLLRETPNIAGTSNVVLPMLGSSINVEHLYRSEVCRTVIPAARRITGINTTKCTKLKPGSVWELG